MSKKSIWIIVGVMSMALAGIFGVPADLKEPIGLGRPPCLKVALERYEKRLSKTSLLEDDGPRFHEWCVGNSRITSLWVNRLSIHKSTTGDGA